MIHGTAQASTMQPLTKGILHIPEVCNSLSTTAILGK